MKEDELKNTIEELELIIGSLKQTCYNDLKEIERLQQQLKEKDNGIKTLLINYTNYLRYFIRHNSKNGIILESDLQNEISEIENGDKIWQTKNIYEEHDKKLIQKIRGWIKTQIVYCGGKADEMDILIANASNQVLKDIGEFLDQLEGEQNDN